MAAATAAWRAAKRDETLTIAGCVAIGTRARGTPCHELPGKTFRLNLHWQNYPSQLWDRAVMIPRTENAFAEQIVPQANRSRGTPQREGAFFHLYL